jgi:hypothetical protein
MSNRHLLVIVFTRGFDLWIKFHLMVLAHLCLCIKSFKTRVNRYILILLLHHGYFYTPLYNVLFWLISERFLLCLKEFYLQIH